MTEHKYEQVEGAVEHTVQNTPARFGVKLESHGWFDGWGLCPDVRGKSERIEFRRKDRFRKIQTIEVIGADGNDLAHELLHHGARRGETPRKVREPEAEAVAFVVPEAVSPDTNTACGDCIHLYQGDIETLTESLGATQQVASTILEALMPEESESAAA